MASHITNEVNKSVYSYTNKLTLALLSPALLSLADRYHILHLYLTNKLQYITNYTNTHMYLV